MTGLFDAPVQALAPIASHQLVEMLRAHYLPPNRPASGIFATEIEAPRGSRRADVLWAPLVTYAGSGLTGHEIKVTRSDLLTELADPTKADPWARHCTWWWLVVASPAMIEGLDIPGAWGIMAPPSGRRRRSMTVIRQAPRLNPPNDGPAWHRLAAWQHHRLSTKLYEAEHDRDRYKREVDLGREEVARGELQRFGRESEHAEHVGRILREIERRRVESASGVYVGREDIGDADIVDALLDLGRIRSISDQLVDSLRWRIDELRRAASPIEEAAKALDAIVKAAA